MQRFDDYNFDNDKSNNNSRTQREQPGASKPNMKNGSVRYSRRGAAPTVYNGMHRRRQRRIMW